MARLNIDKDLLKLLQDSFEENYYDGFTEDIQFKTADSVAYLGNEYVNDNDIEDNETNFEKGMLTDGSKDIDRVVKDVVDDYKDTYKKYIDIEFFENDKMDLNEVEKIFDENYPELNDYFVKLLQEKLDYSLDGHSFHPGPDFYDGINGDGTGGH